MMSKLSNQAIITLDEEVQPCFLLLTHNISNFPLIAVYGERGFFFTPETTSKLFGHNKVSKLKLTDKSYCGN